MPWSKRWAIVPVSLTGDIGQPFPQRYRKRKAAHIAQAMTGSPRFGKPKFTAMRV